MATTTTCPRGHALDENAVYCTVCWIRVEPEDPARVAARKSRLRRTFLGIPLLIGASILIGVGVGHVLGGNAGGPDVTVLALPAASAAPTPALAPAQSTAAVAADAPSAAAVAAPLAATLADPVKPATDGSCVLQLRDQSAPCETSTDSTTVTVCVPDATAVLVVGMRPAGSSSWQDVASQARLGGFTSCPAGAMPAEVSIDATDVGAPDAEWRLVSRDAGGERLWKSRLISAS